MQAKEFSLLSYADKLKVIGNSGRLKHSVISNGYQFSVYRVKSFYVELKRNIKQLSFEKITAMYTSTYLLSIRAANSTKTHGSLYASPANSRCSIFFQPSL